MKTGAGGNAVNVYLVQHGEAQPKDIDPARPLTERGREEAQRVASFAARLGLAVGQICHSGKTRAEQTAALFGEALSPPGGVVAVHGLASLDDVRSVADARQAFEGILGAEGFLSRSQAQVQAPEG
jgi:phosphohistidine phosphatase